MNCGGTVTCIDSSRFERSRVCPPCRMSRSRVARAVAGVHVAVRFMVLSTVSCGCCAIAGSDAVEIFQSVNGTVSRRC